MFGFEFSRNTAENLQSYVKTSKNGPLWSFKMQYILLSRQRENIFTSLTYFYF